jgi:Condensation domain
VIGTPFANRNVPGVEGLLGCFVNTLAIRLGTAPSSTFTTALQHARAATTAAFAHGATPFAQVVDRLGAVRSAAFTPVYQVSALQLVAAAITCVHLSFMRPGLGPQPIPSHDAMVLCHMVAGHAGGRRRRSGCQHNIFAAAARFRTLRLRNVLRAHRPHRFAQHQVHKLCIHDSLVFQHPCESL